MFFFVPGHQTITRHFALITLFCEKFLQFFSSKILISKPDQISEIRSLFSFLARSNYTYTTLFLKRHQAVLHFQLPNDGLFFSRLVLEYFVISSGLLRLCWLKNVATASPRSSSEIFLCLKGSETFSEQSNFLL